MIFTCISYLFSLAWAAEIDINECRGNNGQGPCQDACRNLLGSFRCECHTPGLMLARDGISCIDFDECLEDNFRCSHWCINTQGTAFCSCPPGMVLLENEKDCIDIDECEEGACSHFCNNTVGSFVCFCPNGLQLDNNNQTCTETQLVQQFRQPEQFERMARLIQKVDDLEVQMLKVDEQGRQMINFMIIIKDLLPKLSTDDNLKIGNKRELTKPNEFQHSIVENNSDCIKSPPIPTMITPDGRILSWKTTTSYIINPTPPYIAYLPSGASETTAIFISGQVREGARRFNIDLQSGENVPFHFNPRWTDHGNMVYRDAYKNGHWTAQESEIPFFPFEYNRHFDIAIFLKQNEFEVFVNDKKFISYKHKTEVDHIERILITPPTSIIIFQISFHL